MLSISTKKTIENKKIHTEEQNQIKIFREQNDRILFYYGFCSDFKFQVEIRALDCIFITFFLNKRFMQIVVHFVLKSYFFVYLKFSEMSRQRKEIRDRIYFIVD